VVKELGSDELDNNWRANRENMFNCTFKNIYKFQVDQDASKRFYIHQIPKIMIRQLGGN
jgi:hypothetical protein